MLKTFNVRLIKKKQANDLQKTSKLIDASINNIISIINITLIDDLSKTFN